MNNSRLKPEAVLLVTLFSIYCFGITHAQTKLKITGAYNYGNSDIPGGRSVAIKTFGPCDAIWDADDIKFVDAVTNKETGRAIDDFAFLSPDEKEYWINLPVNYKNKNISAIFIVWLPNEIKDVKLRFDTQDISDSAPIKGNYPLLPPVKNRIRHRPPDKSNVRE